MVGFPAELLWLKGDEKGGGIFPFDLLRGVQGALCGWQTHLACNCSDHSDNQP